MLRTIWGDNERYLQTYWEKFDNRYYVAGDSAHRDADGYYWIMGRIDDVLNVAGHRLGTMEIESALVAHPRVAEAAVVGKPHDIKGEAVFAYVVLNIDRPDDEETAAALTQDLREWVASQLSPIAKPDDIRFTDNLPKTRSGKIMRRLLRSIARGEEITQDVSTLENPAILDQLRGVPQAAVHPAKRRAPAPISKVRKPAPGSARLRTAASRNQKTAAAKKKSGAKQGGARNGNLKKAASPKRSSKRAGLPRKAAAGARRGAVRTLKRKSRGKK
jgi:hypothetical protein